MADRKTLLCWQVIGLLKYDGYFLLIFTEKRLRNPQSHLKTILTFNNNVLEFFYGTSNDETKRFHVGQIKSIELSTDKIGKHSLVMSTKFNTVKEEVSDKALGKTKQLVAEVQRALQSTPFVLDHVP